MVRAALEALDIDGDWDADAYDQQMAAVLAETDGMGTGGDDDKPTWEDDIDIGDIVPEASRASAAKESKKAKKKERKKRMREDGASAVDVDVDEMDADAPTHGGNTWDEVEWDGTEEMRKHVLDQYMEELYELEFNDMVRPLHHAALMHTTHIYIGCRDAHTLPLHPCSQHLIWAECLGNPTCGR